MSVWHKVKDNPMINHKANSQLILHRIINISMKIQILKFTVTWIVFLLLFNFRGLNNIVIVNCDKIENNNIQIEQTLKILSRNSNYSLGKGQNQNQNQTTTESNWMEESVKNLQKPERSTKLKIKILEYKNCDEDNCQQFVCSDKRDPKFNISVDLNSCSTSSIPDSRYVMSVIVCNNPNECKQILKVLQNLDSWNIPDVFQLSDLVLDTCHNSYNDYVTLNSPKTFMRGMILCRTRDGTRYNYLQFFRTVDQDENQILLYSDFSDSENTSDSKAKNASNLDYELPAQTDLNLYISDASTVIKIDIISVESKIRDGVENTEIEIRCRWSNFPFARGSKWLIEYSNETITTPEIFDNNITDFKDPMSQMDTIVLDEPEHIVSFTCLVPVLNSDRWINLTYPFTFPKITNASDSVLTFYETDEDITIFCVVEGSPPLTVEWYIKGKPVNDKDAKGQYHELNATTMSYALHFTHAKVDGSTIAGNYTCNATNFKGTSLHSVYIEIIRPIAIPERNEVWIYWFLGFGFLFLTIAYAFVYKRLRDRKKLIESLREQLKSTSASIKSHPVDSIARPLLADGFKEALEVGYNKEYEVDTEEIDFVLSGSSPTKIGQGHFGSVMLATYKNEFVAVKTLERKTKENIINFIEELKILIYVNSGKHENIVRLVGAVTENLPSIQIILEYCSEGSLKHFLQRNKTLFSTNAASSNDVSLTPGYCKVEAVISTNDLIEWSYQFACGMEYLAGKKLIHGDLAARNLLLTSTRKLKISDFGLSKISRKYNPIYFPNPNKEKQDLPMLSLALECFEKKPLSTESDVWAFGITLWEIFSLGEDPVLSDSEVPQFHYMMLKGGKRLDSPENTPMKIYNVMQNCWKENPLERPKFPELAKSLRDILNPSTSNNSAVVIQHQQEEPDEEILPFLLMLESNPEWESIFGDDEDTRSNKNYSDEVSLNVFEVTSGVVHQIKIPS